MGRGSKNCILWKVHPFSKETRENGGQGQMSLFPAMSCLGQHDYIRACWEWMPPTSRDIITPLPHSRANSQPVDSQWVQRNVCQTASLLLLSGSLATGLMMIG